MSKSDKAIEQEIRLKFTEAGCKKAGYIDYILENKSIFAVFFTKTLKNVETSIGIRYVALNEFAFYLSKYGSDYKGTMLVGPWRPDKLSIPNSWHVSGVASLGLDHGKDLKVFDGGDVSKFVESCLGSAHFLLKKHGDMLPSLKESLKSDPPADYAIPVTIFLDDFKKARELVESRREEDGDFLGHVPRQADRYLTDLGY